MTRTISGQLPADVTLHVPVGKPERRVENSPSSSRGQEKEKTKTIAKTINENASPRLSGSQSDSEVGDPSDEERGSSENEEKDAKALKRHSSPAIRRYATSAPPTEQNSPSTQVPKTQRRARSLSMHALSNSSELLPYYAQPPSDDEESGKPSLMKTEGQRHKEYKSEVAALKANYNFLKSQNFFYEESQDLIETIILSVKEINKKLLEPIDKQLKIHGDYYKVTNQLNAGFKAFCKHLCSFYDEMQELHQTLNDDLLHMENGGEKQSLCHQLGVYLANEKASIEEIKKFEESSFLKLLNENQSLLHSTIQQHIGNQSLLAKAKHEFGNATHEKHVEKGQDKPFYSLWQIPHQFAEEKQLLEELHSKLKTRITMRHKLSSDAEHAGKEMTAKWIESVKKLIEHKVHSKSQ